MKGKPTGAGFLAVGLVGLQPALQLVTHEDDFQAVISFVIWILVGIVIVKLLAIFAGVS